MGENYTFSSRVGAQEMPNLIQHTHSYKITYAAMRGLIAVSQLLGSEKDREEWFSLGENHEKVRGFGLHQLRNRYRRWLFPQGSPMHSFQRSGRSFWNLAISSMHWGPDPTEDRWQLSSNKRAGLHREFHQDFHTFGLDWSSKYIFTWIDTRLAQVIYARFDVPFFKKGSFSPTYTNGTRLLDPWGGSGTSKATPFDRPFYLTLALSVGGTSGWFLDGVQEKPWADASENPRADFYSARDRWLPTWEKPGQGEMLLRKVSMWQQCDDGAQFL